jgi:hypothetical protein
MRTIRIDEDVWIQLQKRAQPFVDSPNDVLRRLLQLNESRRAVPDSRLRRRRTNMLQAGERTIERDFYKPILEALERLGGRGRVSDVLIYVEEKMRSRFKPADIDTISTGEQRWSNTAKWARKHMIVNERPPLLNPSSPRGWWEITDAGRGYLRNGHS